MNEKNKIIKKYTNPSLPGSFSGYSGFIKNNKEYGKSLLAKEALQSLPSYTLHVEKRKKFPRRPVLVRKIDDQWQVDLVDMSEKQGSNASIRYILTCIDVFSKYAWAVPMKTKTANSTAEAFKIIFKDNRKPDSIYSDDGNEFKGSCKQLLESKGIKIVITTSKRVKAGVVERFNRTLKQTIYRYLTFLKDQPKKTNLEANRYYNVLSDIVQAYNNSYHTSIKMTPNEVRSSNSKQVFYNLYGYDSEEGDDTFVKVKFKRGTYVRILQEKNLFEKSYSANWSKNILIVSKVFAYVPLMYEISNIESEKPIGNFYAEQLQQVQMPFDAYEIIEDNNDSLKVIQINTPDPVVEEVNKDSFLNTNRYRLRERKAKNE